MMSSKLCIHRGSGATETASRSCLRLSDPTRHRVCVLVTGVNDCGGGRLSVKSGLRVALLDSRRFYSVATGTVSTRTMVDPAFGRKMGSRGHFTPSGAQPATWGNMPNVAFYVNVESETCGCCHVIATNAHVRLVSYKAAYIDRWRSEVAQWLRLPLQHPPRISV